MGEKLLVMQKTESSLAKTREVSNASSRSRRVTGKLTKSQLGLKRKSRSGDVDFIVKRHKI